MTQAELARIVGVSFPQMQKYETGANRMSVAMLIRIAKALTIETDAIIEVACADLANYLKLSGQAPDHATKR